MTNHALLKDCYAVLLPAFGEADYTGESQAFFRNGGVATLLGCSREEYVARRMSKERAMREDAGLFRSYARRARGDAGRPVLIAIDYEIGGVHRLHDLAPQLSHPSDALDLTEAEIERFGQEAGAVARDLGINLFLAPVLDILTGPNPWLKNRTLAAEPARVGKITSAFIRGVQSQGIAATAKHFPGHHHVAADPYDDARVVVPGPRNDLEPGFTPYRQAIAAGVKCVMTGPVPTEGMDLEQPSSSSAVVTRALREEFGFKGLIISDDIDLPGTMRGRSLSEVAISGIAAGIELLLLASGPQVYDIAVSLAKAVADGRIAQETVATAAAAVRRLADDLA